MWRRAAGVVSRRVADGVLLLTPTGPDPFEVVGPAAELWWLLDPPVSTEAAAGQLAEQFGADPVAVARDIEGLLADLVERGAVEPVPEAATVGGGPSGGGDQR